MFARIRDSYANPRRKSRVSITVSNSPNLSRVYIRLCKHGKLVRDIYDAPEICDKAIMKVEVLFLQH